MTIPLNLKPRFYAIIMSKSGVLEPSLPNWACITALSVGVLAQAGLPRIGAPLEHQPLTHIYRLFWNPGEIPNADGHPASWHGERTRLRSAAWIISAILLPYIAPNQKQKPI